MVDGYPHRTWCDANGRALIEDYEITGLAHGTPLATLGEGAVGAAMPHMLEAGISSTRHIAAFFGGLGGRVRGWLRVLNHRRSSRDLRRRALPLQPYQREWAR